MNIDLVVVGKTDSREVDVLVEMYAKRINFYAKFSIVYLPDVKNTRKLSQAQQRTAEGEAILRQVGDGDYLLLLDEHGDELRSVEFAAWMQKRMAGGLRRLVFVIGGPYGFSDAVYSRADGNNVAVADDVLAPNRPRNLRRTTLSGVYDYPQRTLSPRIVLER